MTEGTGKIQTVGPWNVEFLGFVYDGGEAYEEVLFEKFDGDTPVPGSRKALYFRMDRELHTPEFQREGEIERYMKFPDKARVEVRTVPEMER